MTRLKTDKALYQEVVLDKETGEVTRQKTVYKTSDEPDFIKLYIDCVLTLKGMKKGLNPILLNFLRFMSYANINAIEGGQVIFVNKMMKQTIADSLGVTIKRIDQAITEFVKGGIFKRIAVGTYQVNPNLVGKGEWKDIKNIRATFDFGRKEVVADLVKKVDSLTEVFQAEEADTDNEQIAENI